MTRRNPPAKWVLPDVVDPPERICFRVMVPKNAYHLAAFRGALLALASAYNWQDDLAHTAKDVALVWRNVYDLVRAIDCESAQAIQGMEIEDFMPLRVDCDCNVWVTCCDGTELQLATVKMLQQPGQPSSGSRPDPGHDATNCYSLQANQQLNLPFVVYPGDTLEITSATGAGNDGGTTRWDLANGDQFFGGLDVGFPAFDGSDPLTSAYHMRLIYGIGTTPTWVDAMGGPITVGGSGPQQVVIQVNDSAIDNNSGSYQLCVKLTNNQTGTWSHSIDFRVTSGGFTPVSSGASDPATWVPGTGWVYNTFVAANGFTLHKTNAVSSHYTQTTVDMILSGTVNSTGHAYGPSGNDTFGTHTSGAQTFVINNAPTTGTDASLAADGVIASSGGACTIVSALFEGTGVDPF